MEAETISVEQQEPTKIWNITFISIFIVNMAMSLGQFMSNSLLSIYADSLGATAGAIGMMMSSFAISALLFKIISAPAMDTYNRKHLLIGSIFFFVIAYVGYSASKSVAALMVFRLIQGCGMAFGGVCCLAMVAETLPKASYGAGMGYYSLAQVTSQAIGPTIGLWLSKLVGYHWTFIISAGVMGVSVLLALRIKIRFKRTKKLKIALNNIIAKEALLPASALLFLATAISIVNSFLIVYADKQGVVGNIGLFFMVSALTMLITRPVVGKLTDKFGLVRVFVPAIFCDVFAFFILSFAHTLSVFLIAAFFSAFGFGACQPALQSLAMKSVSNERRGAGSSTNFIGMDLGNLIGPTVAGLIAQACGYAIMWRVMVIPLIGAILLVFLFRNKIAQIESNFVANLKSP